MCTEDKQLLLKDLSARLPYEVICQMEDKLIINDSPFYDYTLSERHIDLFRNHKDFYIKPYLRPMSTMTLKELEEYRRFGDHIRDTECKIHIANYNQIDWLNKHHFDYRGLIEQGFAIEAPKEMYGEEE